MSTIKIARYQLRDAMRSSWFVANALFFLVATDAFFRFGGTGDRVIISLMNVVLFVVPLVAIVLGTMFLYNSREYIELMLSQPIERRSLYRGLYAGLTLPLAAGFLLGVGLPFLYRGAAGGAALLVLMLAGVGLTFIFVALAFAIALRTEDRIRGIGAALLAWLAFAVLYDGVVLLMLEAFSDYPLQHATIAISLLNPLDLGRIVLLLNLDAAAMMGFTGAVFERFFGSALGQLVSVAALTVWIVVPYLAGGRAFARRNF
jgi:Cu-processing system permease protein